MTEPTWQAVDAELEVRERLVGIIDALEIDDRDLGTLNARLLLADLDAIAEMSACSDGLLTSQRDSL